MAPAASRRLLHVVKDCLQSCADMVQGAVHYLAVALDHGKSTRKRVSGLPAALKGDKDGYPTQKTLPSLLPIALYGRGCT